MNAAEEKKQIQLMAHKHATTALHQSAPENTGLWVQKEISGHFSFRGAGWQSDKSRRAVPACLAKASCVSPDTCFLLNAEQNNRDMFCKHILIFSSHLLFQRRHSVHACAAPAPSKRLKNKTLMKKKTRLFSNRGTECAQASLKVNLCGVFKKTWRTVRAAQNFSGPGQELWRSLQIFSTPESEKTGNRLDFTAVWQHTMNQYWQCHHFSRSKSIRSVNRLQVGACIWAARTHSSNGTERMTASHKLTPAVNSSMQACMLPAALPFFCSSRDWRVNICFLNSFHAEWLHTWKRSRSKYLHLLLRF